MDDSEPWTLFVNILDTDVLSHLQKADAVGAAITLAMATTPDQDFRTTTINAYEMPDRAFGLIQELRKKRETLIPGLQLFHDLLNDLSLWRGRIFGLAMWRNGSIGASRLGCVRDSEMTRGSRRSRSHKGQRSGPAT